MFGLVFQNVGLNQRVDRNTLIYKIGRLGVGEELGAGCEVLGGVDRGAERQEAR